MTDPFGIRPAPGPDQPPIPVRLVTFNTHHGVGEDDRHDLPRRPTPTNLTAPQPDTHEVIGPQARP